MGLKSRAWPARANPTAIIELLTLPPNGLNKQLRPPPHSLCGAASCPSKDAVSIACKPVSCPYSGSSVALDGSCRVNLPGANAAYTVNGAAALSIVCPPPGTRMQVKASVEDYLGSCSYEGPMFEVTCERC